MPENADLQPSREPKERALANVRDALAALESVPGVALDDSKFVQLQSAADDVASLERALTNEVEQLRETQDSEIRTDGGDCSHPTHLVQNPSMPSLGEAIEDGKMCLEGECGECGATVLVDGRVQDVIELE